jgi:hypothetical protein
MSSFVVVSAWRVLPASETRSCTGLGTRPVMRGSCAGACARAELPQCRG